ncbi:hypothetical protein [Natranaerofaba carboxydovora]|uniref:hypothetical protein n=1 Tax=Natranaerofaba carboxydovora TaxID=2742683 RepID=UPI001F12D285|nr:hypothetical protein [Natranaerofaba carboxydovora]UMZ73678.1 hypothetical protein ACONDI_01241 [Natranaerofaba carboxydovora]
MTKNQVFETFGENCKEGMNDCLKMQKEFLSLLEETTTELNLNDFATKFGSKSLSVWQQLAQSQQEVMKKWTNKINENNMANFVNPFNVINTMPDSEITTAPFKAAEQQFETWMNLMNKTFETMSNQVQSSASKKKSA